VVVAAAGCFTATGFKAAVGSTPDPRTVGRVASLTAVGFPAERRPRRAGPSMLVRVLMSWRSFRVLIDFCRVFAEKPACPCPGFLRKILKSDPGILVWPGIRVWLRSMADARKIPADLIEQGGSPTRPGGA